MYVIHVPLYLTCIHLRADLESSKTTLEKLVYTSPKRNLTYITDGDAGKPPSHKQEHLACFYSGLLAQGVSALSSHMGAMGPDVELRHRFAAEGIAETCYLTYADSATGIGPEDVQFVCSLF